LHYKPILVGGEPVRYLGSISESSGIVNLPIRHICTERNPWAPGMGKAIHPDASQVSEHYDSSMFHHDYVTYRCPWCAKVFEEDLPN
jgi:hypothetical protein